MRSRVSLRPAATTWRALSWVGRRVGEEEEREKGVERKKKVSARRGRKKKRRRKAKVERLKRRLKKVEGARNSVSPFRDLCGQLRRSLFFSRGRNETGGRRFLASSEGGIERVRGASAACPKRISKNDQFARLRFFRGRRSLLALKGDDFKSSPLALAAGKCRARIPPRSPGLLPQFDPHCDARGVPLAPRAGSNGRKGREEKVGRGRGREREEPWFSKFGLLSLHWISEFKRAAAGTRPSLRPFRSPIPPAGWQEEGVARLSVGGKGSREGSKHQRRSAERGRRSRAKKQKSKEQPALPPSCVLALFCFPPCHQKKIARPLEFRNANAPRALVTDLDGTAARRRDRAHRGHGPEHGRGHLERRSGFLRRGERAGDVKSIWGKRKSEESRRRAACESCHEFFFFFRSSTPTTGTLSLSSVSLSRLSFPPFFHAKGHEAHASRPLQKRIVITSKRKKQRTQRNA